MSHRTTPLTYVSGPDSGQTRHRYQRSSSTSSTNADANLVARMVRRRSKTIEERGVSGTGELQVNGAPNAGNALKKGSEEDPTT